MKIQYFLNEQSRIDESAFVADGAKIIGSVHLCKGASVWHNAVCRGDVNRIHIGEFSNVQDLCTVHADHVEISESGETIYPGHSTYVGNFVTIGHNCVIHACKIGDECLIGMGAVIMDGAEIGDQCIVGAGAVVTKGNKFPPRSLIIGTPARAVRELSSAEVAGLRAHAMMYYELAKEHKNLQRRSEYSR